VKAGASYGLVVLLVFASGLLSAVQPSDKVGIVKGAVTIQGKPTSDSVVSIEGIQHEGKKSTTPKNLIMDQRDMRFVPRVLPVLVGTTVEFPNNDNAWHNVYSASETKNFNLGLYAPKQGRSTAFDKPGVVRILCNVHPQMEAFIVVKAHPFFAATNKSGSYQLTNVPLGKYVLEFWHPDFGTRKIPFELVREGQVMVIDADLKK
jgi:plastocyanin